MGRRALLVQNVTREFVRRFSKDLDVKYIFLILAILTAFMLFAVQYVLFSPYS